MHNRRFGNMALALAATVFGLLLVEAGLRLFDRDPGTQPVTGNQYNFYRFDAVLGWANTPDARGVFARAEFSYDLRINSHGLRGAEIAVEKPARMRRIAVLGDSFVWGIGASDAEMFTTRLESRLPNTQILNFGVAGYGPAQYYLQTDDVLRFEPDAVVVGFCLGNDFTDSVFWRRYGYYKPYARLDAEGALILDGYPLPDVKRFPSRREGGIRGWLHDRSQLYRLVARHTAELVGRAGSFRQRGPADFDERQADVYLNPGKASVRSVVEINRRLLQGLVAAYRARGIPIIVLAVPSKCEFGACFGMKGPSDAARNALQAAVENLGVPLIDPTGNFTLADFWKKDGHWRSSGHDKIVEALLPAVVAALAGTKSP